MASPPSTQPACARRRGGNRLPASHPAYGRAPAYTRNRELSDDPERRDRNQRSRTYHAAAMAQRRGELPAALAAVLGVLLDASDDRLAPGWWSLATIARMVLGEDRYGDDPRGGQRTAARWMAALADLGWIERQHRFVKMGGGMIRGTSNIWRIQIPAHLREHLHAAEDAKRAKAAHRHGGRVTTPPSGSPSPVRRDRPSCDTCGGSSWIEAEHDRMAVVPCPACSPPRASP